MKVLGYLHFLKTSIFDPLCFLKWCPIFDGPCEHLGKSNQKNIFTLLIFLLKSLLTHVRKTPPLRSHYSTSWQAVDMLNINILYTYSTCSMQNEQYMLMHAAIIKMIIGISMEMKGKSFDSMLSPYLSRLDSCNSQGWNIQFGELNFFPSLNWFLLPV